MRDLMYSPKPSGTRKIKVWSTRSYHGNNDVPYMTSKNSPRNTASRYHGNNAAPTMTYANTAHHGAKKTKTTAMASNTTRFHMGMIIAYSLNGALVVRHVELLTFGDQDLIVREKKT